MNYSELSGLFFIKELHVPPSHFSQQELRKRKGELLKAEDVCDTPIPARGADAILLQIAPPFHLILFLSGCPLITCKALRGIPFYLLNASFVTSCFLHTRFSEGMGERVQAGTLGGVMQVLLVV